MKMSVVTLTESEANHASRRVPYSQLGNYGTSPERPLSQPYFGWGLGEENGLNYQETQRNFQRQWNSGYVNMSLALYSRCLAYTPFLVQERSKGANGEWEWNATDTPMESLLNNPCGYYPGADTFVDFYSKCLTSYFMDKCFIEIIYSGAPYYMPCGFRWLQHWLVYPMGPNDGSELIDHYIYRVNGQDRRIEKENIIAWGMGTDPYNERLARSPLKTVWKEIGCEEEFSTYTKAVTENAIVMGGAISPSTTDGSLGDDGGDRLVRDLSSRTTGRNRGSWSVFEFPVQVAEFGKTPQDMALDTIQIAPCEKILGAMGTSRQLLNLWFNGIITPADKKVMAAFYRDSYLPTMLSLGNAMRVNLMGRPSMGKPEKQRIWLSTRDVWALQDDIQVKADVADAHYLAGVWSQNESRAYTDQPPVKEGETRADGDKFHWENPQLINGQAGGGLAPKNQHAATILKGTNGIPANMPGKSVRGVAKVTAMKALIAAMDWSGDGLAEFQEPETQIVLAGSVEDLRNGVGAASYSNGNGAAH